MQANALPTYMGYVSLMAPLVLPGNTSDSLDTRDPRDLPLPDLSTYGRTVGLAQRAGVSYPKFSAGLFRPKKSFFTGMLPRNGSH